jgi:hypothetical protein
MGSKVNDDYKLYLDERFNGINILINAHFKDVSERLDTISAQTTKTNGRVNQLELNGISHPLTCPQVKKIEDLEKGLQDAMFFQRHPKLGIGIIGVFVFMFLFSAYTLFEQSRTIMKSSKTHTEQIMTQADSINNSNK